MKCHRRWTDTAFESIYVIATADLLALGARAEGRQRA
jgi:hypothetical protein